VENDAAAIRAARLRQNEAIAAHDLAAIEMTWESDVVVTAGMGVAFQGATQYRKAFEDEFAAFPDTKYERRPEAIDVSSVRPLAAERGSWTREWTSKSGKGEMRGSYMAMWQKTNGEWRIRSELYVLLSCSGQGCPAPKAP
jgi:ketosteroid isomerase-like protein